MMSKIRELHRELCVRRMDKETLHATAAIVADPNASSTYVRFGAGIAGLGRINKEIVFADSWIHQGDKIAEWRHGSAMCDEVLILGYVVRAFGKARYNPA